MTVSCPTPQWPSGLLEVGPAQDPSIMLRSIAEIAGALYAVVAIRIDPISMDADFRDDVPAHAYKELQAQDILDELSLYTEVTDRSIVRLSGGAYVMLMVPAGGE